MDAGSQTVSWDGLSVHPAKGIVSNGEKEVILTKNEMIMLEIKGAPSPGACGWQHTLG